MKKKPNVIYRNHYPTQEQIVERFFSFVKKTDKCWIWQGRVSSRGYGKFYIPGPDSGKRNDAPAHRFCFEIFNGKLPPFKPGSMQLDHLCRNRLCVRPEHLELVTPRTNSIRSAHATKLFCKRGHPFTLENTRIFKEKRFCRACARMRWRKKSGWSRPTGFPIKRPIIRKAKNDIASLPDAHNRIIDLIPGAVAG